MFDRRRKNQGLSFYKRSSGKFNRKIIYEIFSWIFVLLLAMFLAIAITNLFLIKTSMVGSSMEPILSAGQEVLINKCVYALSSPQRGDIIVFKPNGNQNSHLYIKRIIGLPGENIEIKDGRVYINGEVYYADYADETLDGGICSDEPVTLANDEYFVLGDNRTNSEDSRSANIGNIKMSMIEGKIWLRLKKDKKSMMRVK